jgi:hypothetical protein
MRGLAFRAAAWLALMLLTSPAAAAAQSREVNITSDSAQGWLPTVDEERLARKTLDDFLAAMDSGRLAEAYARLSNDNRRSETVAAFSARLSKFNALAGRVKERRVIKATWTKDPAAAVARGVYVAFDLVSRFEGIDRHCGYVVLFEPPGGGDFQVTRVEDAFLDNATASAIASKQSPAAVDAAWAVASANCPNTPHDQAAASAPAPLAESPHSSIGYPTVAAALADLKSRRDVTISTEKGWTIANDSASRALWSFSPADYPAYPAAVKRQVIEKDGLVTVEMNILCQAGKAACDDLVRSFNALNDAAIKNAQGRP